MKKFMKYFRILSFIAFIGVLILGSYIFHLSKEIDAKFSKSHKWDIPSRIFSDATYYYPGINIDPVKLKARLNRLAYRDTGSEIKGPGDYSINNSRIDIYLHDFEYPLEDFTGYPVRININENKITDIVGLNTEEKLATLKIEPELIATVFSDNMEDRTLVTLQETPQHLLEAIITIEDERFFKHAGVDVIAIARAAIKDILALGIVQGGSTLTQQLVKNYFLTDQRTMLRKVKEAIIALILESKYSKAEILEAYINEIYLGQRGSSSVSGVGEAAKLYFAKNVDQLTLGESALLAGMIQAPNRYNPFTKKQQAANRRNLVLNKLYKHNLISKNEFEKALTEPIITPVKATKTNLAPYFIDFVKFQLANLYSDNILKTQGLKIFTTLDMYEQLTGEQIVRTELDRLEKDYASRLPKDHKDELQAALVSIQPQTGYIRTMIGGKNYIKSQFNRITQALRQPGSTFKPFVYLTAFDPKRTHNLYAPASIIEDTSFDIEAGGKNWSPKNYDKLEHGPVSLRQALTKSYNIATAKLALNISLDAIVKTARDCGITSELMAVPSISLGSFEVTPLEMAAAYTIFPNGGIRVEPISIINVVTKDREMLERKTIEMKRVFDPEPVYLVNSILKDVVDHGTGAGSRKYGFTGIAGGKTGTTSNYRDSWFVGFTPDYLALAWVGYDDNEITNLSGASGALPIWSKFMKQVVGENTKDFTSPKNIVLVKVHKQTGLLASPRCSGDNIFEAFIEGTEPDKHCPSY